MNLKKAFSKHHFFTKNLLNLKWIVLLYTLLLIYQYPVGFLTTESRYAHMSYDSMNPSIYTGGVTLLTFFIVIIPVLIAILSFAYLSNTSQSTQIHSLPVSRKRLFADHYASGILAVLLPHIITGLVLIIAAASVPETSLTLEMVFEWFLKASLFNMTFYSIAVLSCMIVGTPIVQGVFSLIIFVLPLGLISMISNILSIVLKGFIQSYSATSMFLSPFTGYLAIINSMRFYIVPEWFTGLTLLYLLVSTALAYQLYQRIKVENCENTVQFELLLPYLKWLGVFCFMIVIGNFMYDITSIRLLLPVGCLIGIICGYIVLEMIVQKSFKCRISYKEIAMMVIVFAVIFSIPAFDLLGYGEKTMEISEIEAVFFSDGFVSQEYQLDNMLTSDESIEAVYSLYIKSQEKAPTYYWQARVKTHNLSFTFKDKDDNSFSRTFRVNKDELKKELEHLLQSEEYLKELRPVLGIESSDILHLMVVTPLGRKNITDKDTISQLLMHLKKDIREDSNLLLDSNRIKDISIIFTLPSDSPSNPYTSMDSSVDTVQVGNPAFGQYKSFISYATAQVELEEIIPNADLVSQVLLKPLSSKKTEASKVNYHNLSTLDEADLEVEVITSKTEIKRLLESPLYYGATSNNDYMISIVFSDNNSTVINAFIPASAF